MHLFGMRVINNLLIRSKTTILLVIFFLLKIMRLFQQKSIFIHIEHKYKSLLLIFLTPRIKTMFTRPHQRTITFVY